ncbi:putative F-box domain-containing protein [Helianthus annuus]|uniref:F-box domain-containing protein n=1 Tax=Helianthus annuus TaxID=4232 RepID=A0A9K3DZ82_HELAN|nr:putative F-box domain-containing protein [Helianthus annuus]KAJ0471772.1 putative F-box domain-containing protein [Helianthus annuus]KAJ0647396.1 putative F-box domain-containing protein [Helianthus annuus]KAJ0651274.1 putative F-box domain-containing protein [Helianthus annuus]KAJ0843178.1 putative F-box domain-containing protein [Helianthus annuus]
MLNDLCEELNVEILSRLPTKSLLRFRSVSKSLCARIGSPSFIRIHTLRSPKKVMLRHQFPFKDMYALHSEGQLSCTSIPQVEYPFRSSSIIVGSCNGILCVYENVNGGIHLWNPSIRRKVTIQNRPSWSDYKIRHDPLGFGFDPILDDYKILMRPEKRDVF